MSSSSFDDPSDASDSTRGAPVKNVGAAQVGTIVEERRAKGAFRDLFEVWRRLDRSHLPHELIVAGPGDEVDLGTRRRALPVRAVHRAPCQGYAIVERRPRLATRLRGVCERFLVRSPRLAGWLPRSSFVGASIAAQRPFALDRPLCLENHCLRRLSERVQRWFPPFPTLKPALKA